MQHITDWNNSNIKLKPACHKERVVQLTHYLYMDKPYVSIILPVYNGKKILSLCLDSLMGLEYPKQNLEIIAVDNNSIDTTRDIIRRYEIKYLFETKRGTPAALNRGIQNCRGEIIAFTHQDCIVDKSWIKNIVRGFADSKVGGCGGNILGYNPQSHIEKYCNYRQSYFQSGNVAKGEGPLPWIMLANAAFRRKALEEAGLLDEFFTAEFDIDLSWRIYLRGYRLEYNPEAIVYHKLKDTLAGIWHQCFRCGYDTPRFVKKYGKVYESLYIVPYKDLPYTFKKVLCGFFNFVRNLFIEKKRLKIIFPLFDNIVYSALFWGGIFGWVGLKFQDIKMKYEQA